MNLTVSSLFLLHNLARSPFLTLSSNYHSSNLNIDQIHVQSSLHHFIFSYRITNQVIIKQSSFTNMLASAISLSSKSEYNNQNFTEPLIKKGKKNVTCIHCIFKNCKNRIGEKGGALQTVQCSTSLIYCIFIDNFATFSGSVEIQDAPIGIVNYTLIIKSSAERFGAMMLDGHEVTDIGNIYYSNFTENKAEKWIGGVRLQHNGGNIKFSNFVKNSAQSYGAIWDYGYKPAYRELDHLYILNNTASDIGAGFTSFHLLFIGTANQCVFYGNRNSNGFKGRSILVHSYSSSMNVKNCYFEGEKDTEMTTYFIESTLKDEGTNSFNSNNLTLEDIFNINNVINNV